MYMHVNLQYKGFEAKEYHDQLPKISQPLPAIPLITISEAPNFIDQSTIV